MDRFLLLLAFLLIAGTISCSSEGPETLPVIPATESGALTNPTNPPEPAANGSMLAAPVEPKSADDDQKPIIGIAAFGDVRTVPPDADLPSLAVELVPGLTWEEIKAATPPVDQNQVGDLENFWLIDLAAEEAHRPEFELRLNHRTRQLVRASRLGRASR